MSYHQISWSPEAAGSDIIIYGSDIWPASRQRCCWGACQMLERLKNIKPQSRGFETSRDLAVRRPSAWWIEAPVTVNWSWWVWVELTCTHTQQNTSTWWRHQRETFSALLALCEGNSPVNGEFPSQRPVMRSFDVFFDLRLNKRLSKQSRGWWFETLLHSLWRHCNDKTKQKCAPCTWFLGCLQNNGNKDAFSRWYWCVNILTHYALDHVGVWHRYLRVTSWWRHEVETFSASLFSVSGITVTLVFSL